MSSKKKSAEQFIKEAKEKFGNKYNYNKVIYRGCNEKVIITCPIHGDFEQTPHKHLCGSGYGCQECLKEKKKSERLSNSEEFIEKAKKIHGDKYNYDKVEYIRADKPVIITCLKHGDFEQTPNHHLGGEGCFKCGREHTSDLQRYSREEFINIANKVHNNKYNYDKVNYINYNTDVIITCTDHGDFEQTPHSHIDGSGCPKCNSSKIESLIRDFLNFNNINYIEQYTWEWLVFKNKQFVDFYLPDYNVVIEAQGIQHFIENKFFDKTESFKIRLDRDNNKRNLCLNHGINVYYYSNLIRSNQVDENFKYPYKVFEDIEELFKTIKEDFDKKVLPD